MFSQSPAKSPKPSRKRGKVVQRTIALCYVRLSYTENASEADSPERQEANCRVFCERKGWTSEFYYDVDKHKSGTKEVNRPGWMALKQRMNDADVVAIVANDLARLHRKGWRVGQLIDWVEEHGIYLALAAPGRELDFSDPRDRLTATFIAMLDEYYAADISARVKDSIVYRKNKGVTVGRPPFGTVRNEDGYLIPSPRGAWQLPNGEFVRGRVGDVPPVEGAQWRGYYDCARQVLAIYANGGQGIDGIAHKMEDEGWAFGNRFGQPRRFTGDDVRRVVSNWREYAGLVGSGRAKDKNASMIDNAPSVLRDTGRAVFGLDLLRTVAEMQTTRSITKRPPGAKQIAHPYPLVTLVWCHHCERIAEEKGDPTLRSPLSGTHKPNGYYYRHAESKRCTCQVRSIECSAIEDDFVRLLGLLTLDPAQFPSLMALSLSLSGTVAPRDDADLHREKEDAITKCRRKIEAARYLFEDGDLTREEYVRRKEQNEREIAHWEARTSDTEQTAKELMLCVEALDKMTKLWAYSEPEDRQGLARSLFERITYDLGARRITSFQLKPWAGKYLVLRNALYDDEDVNGGDQRGGDGSTSQGSGGTGNKKAVFSDENSLENETAPIVKPVSRGGAIHAPIGIRTRVSALRGPRPRPLDDRDFSCLALC